MDGSPAADHLKDVLAATGGADFDKLAPGQFKRGMPSSQLSKLDAGEGELRVVEHGIGKADALLVRGDESGVTTALNYASEHIPYLWEPDKRFASIEEVRDDLRHFFSLKSDVGQAAAALYHLDQWSAEIAKEHPGNLARVRAEIDVDQADPALQNFAKQLLVQRLHADQIEVFTGNLHAGIKCCDGNVPQHLQSDVMPFKQASPTFAEDVVLEWEVKRLIPAATKAVPARPSSPSVLRAVDSDGPKDRSKLP